MWYGAIGDRLPFPCHSKHFSVDSIYSQYFFLRLFVLAVNFTVLSFVVADYYL